MKKLIVALVVSAFAVSAFAQKHMVTLEHDADSNRLSSLDYYSQASADTDGDSDTDDAYKASHMAFNYAFAINNNFQVGIRYVSHSETSDGESAAGDVYNNITLKGWYNLKGLTNSSFISFGYDMGTTADTSDEDVAEDDGWSSKSMILGFGHRFELGKLAGMTWAYSPEVNYTSTVTTSNNDDVDAITATSISMNWLKVDVLF